MKIFENYNNAKQKYGVEIVKELSNKGLPPQYLLSACRFLEDGVPIDKVVQSFKEWNKYVMKYYRIDVNNLSYDDFIQTIAKGKKEHLLPNVLYSSNECILYGIDNIKDARNIPNDYCIKTRRKYNILRNEGYSFILIFLPQQKFPYTYVVASIHNGIIDYWDSRNYKMYNNEMDDFRYSKYEDLLPDEAKHIIHKHNNKENINCNKIMKRNKIRLTESQLHRVIKESVRRVVNEGFNPWMEKSQRRYQMLLAAMEQLGKIWEEYDNDYTGLPSALINAQEGDSAKSKTDLVENAMECIRRLREKERAYIQQNQKR